MNGPQLGWIEEQTRRFLDQVAKQSLARELSPADHVEALQVVLGEVEVELQAAKETA